MKANKKQNSDPLKAVNILMRTRWVKPRFRLLTLR